MGGTGQQVAGVVIKPVEDLDVGSVLKAPVDEVRLPHLIRLRGLEADVAASGALARLGDDQPSLVQDPPDRGRRRCAEPLLLEMPGDRDWPRVQPVRGQPSTQLDHPPADVLGRPDRRRLRAPGPRLKRLQASFPITGQKAMKKPAGKPVLASGSRDGKQAGTTM